MVERTLHDGHSRFLQNCELHLITDEGGKAVSQRLEKFKSTHPLFRHGFKINMASPSHPQLSQEHHNMFYPFVGLICETTGNHFKSLKYDTYMWLRKYIER